MRWIAGIVGVLAVAIVGVVVFLVTLDVEDYKGEIASLVQENTGRTLTIDGPLALSWTPRPSVTASGVTLSNAPWGSEPGMISIGALAVGVEFLPLLSGELEVDNLRLADVTVLLEQNADGTGNWQLGAQKSSGGSVGSGKDSPPPFVRSVDLTNTTVLWKEAPDAAAKRYEIAHLRLSAESPLAPLVVDLDVDVDGDILELKGSLPAVAEALRPGATLPVDVAGALAGTDIRLAANIQVERGERGTPSVIRADRVAAGWGDISAVGKARVDLSGARPGIEAEFSSEKIDLAALPGSGDTSGGSGAAAGDPLDTPLPLEALAAIDGRISFAVGQLIAGKLQIADLSATVTLSEGTATVDPVSGVVAGGKVAATAVVDGKARPARLASAGRWTDADFGELVRLLDGSEALQARGDTVWDLSGVGDTPRALLGSSSGKAWVVIEGGKIDNHYWELIAADLTTQFLPFLNNSEHGELNCMVGRWDLTNGTADNTVLLVDSSRAIVAGEGTIDLARQTLDMRLVPQPKDASLISLATPILLTGPIENPTVAPDPVALAKDVGTIVAGSALGPVGLLLPFLSTGGGDQLCPEAIAVAEGRRPKESFTGTRSNNPVDTVTDVGAGVANGVATGVKGAAEGVATGVRGLFDSLRKAVE